MRDISTTDDGYRLDDQVGFLLRQASQRHGAIFAELMPDELTPTQWAALAKLVEFGPCSQNQLGRNTAMDAATIKGVIDRLTRRGLTLTTPDAGDARRLQVAPTPQGLALHARGRAAALEITARTLHPLAAAEQAQFVALLRKLV